MVISVYQLPHVLHLTLDDFVSGDHMILSQQATNSLLRVFRHVDQKIDLLVKTIDRRPVLTDECETILFRVFDHSNKIVIEQEAQVENYDRGHYAVFLTKEQTGSLWLGNYTWVMLLVGGEQERLLYTDRDYGANAPLRVLEGPQPPQSEAQSLNLDDLVMGATSALKGAVQACNPTGAHSLVISTESYFGSVTVEASLDQDIPPQDGDWTVVKEIEYTDETGVSHIGFVGNFTWVRFVFSDTIGLKSASYRNA